MLSTPSGYASMHHILTQAITIGDVAESLVSLDGCSTREQFRELAAARDFDVVGARAQGLVMGFVDVARLPEGEGEVDVEFIDPEALLPQDTPLPRAIVALDRVRLTGFDMGAGASTAFGTQGLILRVRDSIITGGYGRHPEHGTLFDVRTHALLARFESSRLSVINLGLHHIRDRATVVFDDCQLTDILDAPYNASPPPGVQFVGTEAGGAVGGPPGIPRRFDLDELFPGWEDAD